MDLPLGATLPGDYTVVRLLGRGGMGVVYEATHGPTGRRVAVKVLDELLIGERAHVARFRREAETTRALGHPNIVQVLDVHEGRSPAPFFVMELLDGEPLHRVLRREKRIEPRRAVRIMVQVLDALELAHRAGVVHRDVKPSNVFVSRDARGEDHVKVLDFGLAKLLEGDGPKLTRTGAVIGTPRYLSPEQALSGPVDPRADVFAAGVLLHELLVGVPPFAGLGPGELLRVIAEADAPPLVSLAPDIDPVLGAIADRAVRRRRDDRFPSAGEMAAALRSWLPKLGARKRKRSRLGLAIAIVAVAMVGAGVGVGVVWSLSSSSGSDTVASGAAPFAGSTPLAGSPSPAAQPGPVATPALGPAAPVGPPPPLGILECDTYAIRACACRSAAYRGGLCAGAHQAIGDWQKTLVAAPQPQVRAAIAEACRRMAVTLDGPCGP